MNSSDNLLSALRAFGLSSPQAQNLFMDNCTIKTYNKNDVLFSLADRNRKEYFLTEGVLHRYNIDDNGNMITTGFYVGYAIVTPHFARAIEGESIFSLQALTDVQVAEMSVKMFDYLRLNYPAFQQFGQKLIENELTQNMLVDIAYRSHNAKERLLLLRSLYPNLENLIPHSIIASYLGITPAAFSRLRGQLLKKL